MSTLSLLLVVTAALLHATWNFAAKKSGGTSVFAFGTALVTVIVWTPVTFLLTYLSPQYSAGNWLGTCWFFVALSAAVHSVYYVALLHGYKVAPYSVVYPIARGVGPLISSFSAIIIFREALTLGSALGIGLVIAGVFLLSWNQNGSISLGESMKGVGWGALTGLMISAYTITDAYGVKILLMHPVVFDYWTNLVRVFILLPFVATRISEVKISLTRDIRSMLIVAILGPTAYILVLTAIQMSPVSHVAPARELSLLLGAFLGGKFLKEGYLLRRMTAAFLIAIGVGLLSLQ